MNDRTVFPLAAEIKKRRFNQAPGDARFAFLALLIGWPIVLTAQTIDPNSAPMAIGDVQYWGYQIQGVHDPGAVDALVCSRYDMLVLEPTRTDYSETESTNFDTADMVLRLKSSPASDGVTRKLVIAYVDIGEAEDWRWYSHWSELTDGSSCVSFPGFPTFPVDWPDWIITCDPDGWAGNYPVLFWDEEWKDIVINGYTDPAISPVPDFNSILDEVIKDGFDGIYLDWVEAFDDLHVLDVAQNEDPAIDPELEMIQFIGEMRAYGRSFNPNFLVIQQNASSLIDGHETALPAVIDAIALEDTWFAGSADVEWGNPLGGDTPQDPAFQAETLGYLAASFQPAGVPIFTIDYTLNPANIAQVYADSAALGFVPLCAQTSLSQLTDSPPPGYSDNCGNEASNWQGYR